jgi:hypothetical protein
MKIPWAHFSKQSIGDLSGNEVLVSVPLLLMLLLHQEKEEQTQGRGKSGLMCSAATSISLQIWTRVSICKYVQRCMIICAKLHCLNFMCLK